MEMKRSLQTSVPAEFEVKLAISRTSGESACSGNAAEGQDSAE